MTRRRLLSVFALLFVLAALAWRAPAWGRGALERRISTLFGRPASVGSLSVHVFPWRVEVRDVRVGGARPGDPPFLELQRAVARPALLRGWRGAALRELALSGLRVRVQAYEAGGDDLPALHLPEGGGEARIGRLRVEDAEVIVDHRRVPLALDLPEVHGTMASLAGALRGQLSFEAGTVQVADHAPLTLANDAQLALRGGRLEVAQGRLRSEKTDIAYAGSLQLTGGVRGEFDVSGPVDLGVLDRHVMDSGFALSGHARYVGRLRVKGSQVEMDGRLEGTAGEFDGIPVPRYAGELAWKEGRLELRRLDVAALGGRATLDLDLPPPPGVVHLGAQVDGMDAEALSRLVFDIDSAGLGAGASGRIDLRWPRGHTRDLTGTAALDLLARADGRTPLWGRLSWQAQQGRQRIEQADLRTPAAHALLAGSIEKDRRTDLAVDAESADLAAADQLLLRVRRALRIPAPQPAEVAGSGSFHGRWGGTLDAPVFEGRFAGQGFTYLGVNWGRAEWAGAMTSEELRSHSLVLSRDGGELWLDGGLRTGPYGDDDALDLTVRLQGWPAADLSRALEWDLPLQGRLTGEAALHGRRSRPQGQARVQSESGTYFGVPYHDLRLALTLAGDHVRLREGTAGLGSGSVRFHGTRSEDGVYDAAAEVQGVELSDLAPADWPAALRPGGRVSGSLVAQGPWSARACARRSTRPACSWATKASARSTPTSAATAMDGCR